MTDLNSENRIEFLTLKVDGEVYGIDVTTIMEVIRVPEIAPVPSAAKDILGIINLRGKIITILDARRKFSVTESELTNESRIVIIQENDHMLGLLVDEVIEVLKIPKDDIEPSPSLVEGSAQQFFDGIYSKDNRFVIVFNALKLMGEEETEKA